MKGTALAGWLLVGLLLVAPAAAVEESAAAEVRLEETGRDDVVAVWHEPDEVQPGSQWTGHIQFRAHHNVSNVLYQICRVGTYCFAPPTPAERLNETVWRFDTSNYIQPGSGKPVRYEAGWRVGYQFLLEEPDPAGESGDDNGTHVTLFPHGIEASDPACQGADAWIACAETHYFAFTVAGEPDDGRGAPVAGLAWASAALLVALVVRLRSRTR